MCKSGKKEIAQTCGKDDLGCVFPWKDKNIVHRKTRWKGELI